mmetsp:Transcript_12249/g.27773  ORF Transcript_12249/g.27773 Transcript_12249/m.27773 type:complete len:319 (+) Transcript_12249:63-1019(+)
MAGAVSELVADTARICISKEKLNSPPSRADGIDAATEEKLRLYGATIIQKAGMLLRLPQIIIASAAVLFHRLYFEKSFADIDVTAGAGAALFLAAKVEERARKLADVVLALHRVEVREDGAYAGGPAPKIDKESKDYSRLKKRVSAAENHILQAHAYQCDVEHAHKFFLEYCRQMGKTDAMIKLARQGWGHLNDILLSPMYSIYHPSDLAAMCLLLASRELKVKMPSSPPWWEVLDADQAQARWLASRLLEMHRREGPPASVEVQKRKANELATAHQTLQTPQSSPGPMPSPPSDEDAATKADSDSPPQTLKVARLVE